MAFDYFVAEINDTKRYFRVGEHPLTGNYESYISLDNKTWQQIPWNENGPFYSEGNGGIQLTFQPNPFATLLRKIELKDLPRDLLHTEDKELEYFEEELTKQTTDLFRYQLSEIQKEQQKKEKSKLNALVYMHQLVSRDTINKDEEDDSYEFSTEDQKNPPCCSQSCKNITMMTLGLFTGVLGIAAVAVGFTVLLATPAGAASAILGIAAIIGGFGLFGVGAYRYVTQKPDPIELELGPRYVLE